MYLLFYRGADFSQIHRLIKIVNECLFCFVTFVKSGCSSCRVSTSQYFFAYHQEAKFVNRMRVSLKDFNITDPGLLGNCRFRNHFY